MTSVSKRSVRRARAGALLSIAAFITAAALATGPAGASANGPAATGSGHFDLAGKQRTFTFTAVTHNDGSVTGEAQLDAKAIEFSEHIQIDCLQVEGTKAYMSGTITRSTYGFTGHTAVFSVQDNGEGASSDDKISLLHSLIDLPPQPGRCELEHLLPDHPIEQGSVQVH